MNNENTVVCDESPKEAIYHLCLPKKEDALSVSRELLLQGFSFCSTPEKTSGKWFLMAYIASPTGHIDRPTTALVRKLVEGKAGYIQGWSIGQAIGP